MSKKYLILLADVITFYDIQINEIQENIDEITCIFQKVLFSLVKNINFWITYRPTLSTKLYKLYIIKTNSNLVSRI